MVRPRRRRFICSEPGVSYFKPAGIPKSELEEISLNIDEFEALRLCDFEGLSQGEASGKMNVSQPTLNRILSSGRKKVVCAISKGFALRIECGDYFSQKNRNGNENVR